MRVFCSVTWLWLLVKLFDSACIYGKKKALHLATDVWEGCWELVCGHAFQLVSVLVCKWQFEPVVFLALTWTLPEEQVYVSDAAESFVDLINVAKLDWFCLKWYSCCELFCSDPSGRVQVLADLLLFPQELGQTPELGSLCSPTLCHPSWPKSVGALSCPFCPLVLQVFGVLSAWQLSPWVWSLVALQWGWEASVRRPSRCHYDKGAETQTQLWAAWPGCLLCDPHQGHHSLRDWGGAPCTSDISHCWRRNDIYTNRTEAGPCFCGRYGGYIHMLCESCAFLPLCWVLGVPEAPTWHMGCAELRIPPAEPALDGAWAVTSAAFSGECFGAPVGC